MFKNTVQFIKSSWGYFVAFLLGFFLIKRGIDDKVKTSLAIEKAKEDALELEATKRAQEESDKILNKYVNKKQELDKDLKNKKQEIQKNYNDNQSLLNKQAHQNPDEFAKKFSNKFNINYDKGK